MTARNEASSHQVRPSARQSTASRPRQEHTARTQTTQRTRTTTQAARRRTSASGRQGTQASRRPQQSQARRRKRHSSIDIKIVAIVAISLAVVLGVAGFFAHRRGLLDWTGIGMRKVEVSVNASGFDGNSTPIPLHVAGERRSGVTYERDLYLTASQDSFTLPEGNYTVEVLASPICAGGALFTIPDNPRSITIEGRKVQISGTSTATLTLDLTHLDIIDATDEQVEAAITAAQAASGKGAADNVERNIPALQRLRQQSVLPDDMPSELILESVSSGWLTRVSIQADGTFTGSYTQEIANATGEDYPNGTAYTCVFSGRFVNVERIGETGFSMTLDEVTTEHEVGEKWVADGVLNIGSEPVGFETGSTFELWRPGTLTYDLGWWLSGWCADYASSGVPDELDRWALDNADASYGFFSAGPRSAAADATNDTDAVADETTEVDAQN